MLCLDYNTMLILKNIHVTFNQNTSNAIKVLDGIDLDLKENEWTYIIGGNGSGKSTLLKIINQELTQDMGEVLHIDHTSKDILFVDQVTMKNLVPSMTVYENLIFGLKTEGMRANFKFFSNLRFRIKVISILKEFNVRLEDRLNEQVKFLSGGEQQMVVAARIMLSLPKVLLMDEFTSSLDQKWAPFILEKLRKFTFDHNILVLAVTHDYSQLQNIGTRLILLKNGRVQADKKKDDFDFSTQSVLNLFYEQ